MTTTDQNPNRRGWDKAAKFSWLDTESIKQHCNELAVDCYGAAIKAGHYNDPETGEPIRYSVPQLLTLVVKELEEAVIANIDGAMDKHLPHRLGVEVEIADALIILFGACGHLGLDIGNAMAEKLEYNRTREDHAASNGRKR